MASGNIPDTPILGLALGGGGMKGWAHIGVIAALERQDLRPDIIAGTSAGALVGAYYAIGYQVPEMIRMMKAQKTSSLFSFRFDGAALLDNDSLRDLLNEQLRGILIEDLEIPFVAIATDLATGKEVVIDRGPIVDAVLASSALPGIFAPVRVGDRYLVDGGICNNVPVSVLVSRGARYTIGVRLHRDPEALSNTDDRLFPDVGEGADQTKSRAFSNAMWAERLAKTIRRDPNLPSGFDVITRVMELTVAKLERYRLGVYPPDVLIQPVVDHVRTLAFSEEREDILEAGSEAAELNIGTLRSLARKVAAARKAKEPRP